MRVTGERIVSRSGAFNASWQRHSACYAFSARFLGPDPVLDVGCGLGHAYGHLAPRRTVGVDLDHASLVEQDRPTVVSDMRRLPFGGQTFASLISIHAVEHVPDSETALAETARVLKPGGKAVFVTPNRLTFGRPDEIIDPYHYMEYDPDQLRALCGGFFTDVELYGLFGSDRYMQFHLGERRQLDALLKKDPLRLRRLVPRKVRQRLYDWKLTQARKDPSGPGSETTIDDFDLRQEGLDGALDLMAVCANPFPAPLDSQPAPSQQGA